MDDVYFVFVTAPSIDVAKTLAVGIVDKQFSACVNIVDAVTSVYRWQGAIQEGQEVLMLIKTVREKLKSLETWITEHHPYEIPEFVAVRVDAVSERYGAWLVTASD